MRRWLIALLVLAALFQVALHLSNLHQDNEPVPYISHMEMKLSGESPKIERNFELVLKLSQANSENDLRMKPFFANSLISIDVTVMNDLDHAVDLVEITRSCFCTSVTANFKRLAAGKSGHLSLLLQTHSEEGDFSSNIGVVYKAVDREEGFTAQVGFQYRCAMVLSANQPSVWINTTSQMRGAISKILVNRGSMPLSFTDLAANSSNISFASRVVRNSQNSWTVFLDQAADLPAGAICGELVVFPLGNTPENGNLKIAFGGVSKGPFMPIPATIFWGELFLGNSYAEPIVLNGNFSGVSAEALGCEVLKCPNGLTVSISDITRVNDKTAKFLLKCRPQCVGIWKDLLFLSIKLGEKSESVALFVRGTAVNDVLQDSK